MNEINVPTMEFLLMPIIMQKKVKTKENNDALFTTIMNN